MHQQYKTSMERTAPYVRDDRGAESPAMVDEILNYFGKCPRCKYAATATMRTRILSDGTPEREVVATCDLPCGWYGPASPTMMTGRVAG